MVFDDVEWRNATHGMIVFLVLYRHHLEIITSDNCQLFIKKIKKMD